MQGDLLGLQDERQDSPQWPFVHQRIHWLLSPKRHRTGGVKDAVPIQNEGLEIPWRTVGVSRKAEEGGI